MAGLKDFCHSTMASGLIVLMFAQAKEIVGSPQVFLPIEDFSSSPPSPSSVLLALDRRFPALSAVLQTALLAVNGEYVDPSSKDPLNFNDEIALIPPISGG